MANTYTQLYIHYIFVVQNRLSLINNKWQDSLFKYMSGIIEQHEHKLYIINGMPDHVHVLISMNPKQAPSDLMYHLKRSSSLWINENRLVAGRFSWQEGFGAFSLSNSQLMSKVNYIKNQKQHHSRVSFREEYLSFLAESGVEYDEHYVFKSVL